MKRYGQLIGVKPEVFEELYSPRGQTAFWVTDGSAPCLV